MSGARTRPPALGVAHRFEIEAPDGSAALELERRLATIGPTTVWRHGRWFVDLAGVHDADDVEHEVRDWLRQTGTPATTVHVDGRTKTVAATPRPRHRGTHADFIG